MIGEIPKATLENFTQLNDHDLVKKMQGGSNPRLEKVFHDRFYPSVLDFLNTLTNNKEDAEDLAQESFARVLKNLNKYRDTGSFKSWLTTIAKNIFTDEFRKKKRRWNTFSKLPNDEALTNFLINNVQEGALNIEEQLELRDLQKELEKLISKISPDLRKVLIDRMYENKKHKDIAKEEGVSINTSLGRMRYALTNLRKLAREYGISNFES